MNTRERAKQIRRLILKSINSFGSGHVGGSLSIADILAVLYQNHMRVDPEQPKKEDRDRFVLSKAHAGPALYATLSSFGFFPESELLTLNKLGTNLPSHTNAVLTKGVDISAGSLGQGISCAVGVALACRLARNGARVYAIVGDGETQEGQVWEAFSLAAHRKLDNLTVFIDNNGMQIDNTTANILNMEDFEAKMKAFGFHTIRINGHDHDEIDKAIIEAKNTKGMPTAIIADTVKGKGVTFYEQMGVSNHSTNVTNEQLEQALKELA
jgi:transketolase